MGRICRSSGGRVARRASSVGAYDASIGLRAASCICHGSTTSSLQVRHVVRMHVGNGCHAMLALAASRRVS